MTSEQSLSFESRIDEAVPDGAEDGIQKFTGACNTIAFDWSQKQGN